MTTKKLTKLIALYLPYILLGLVDVYKRQDCGPVNTLNCFISNVHSLIGPNFFI